MFMDCLKKDNVYVMRLVFSPLLKIMVTKVLFNSLHGASTGSRKPLTLQRVLGRVCRLMGGTNSAKAIIVE